MAFSLDKFAGGMARGLTRGSNLAKSWAEQERADARLGLAQNANARAQENHDLAIEDKRLEAQADQLIYDSWSRVEGDPPVKVIPKVNPDVPSYAPPAGSDVPVSSAPAQGTDSTASVAPDDVGASDKPVRTAALGSTGTLNDASPPDMQQAGLDPSTAPPLTGGQPTKEALEAPSEGEEAMWALGPKSRTQPKANPRTGQYSTPPGLPPPGHWRQLLNDPKVKGNPKLFKKMHTRYQAYLGKVAKYRSQQLTDAKKAADLQGKQLENTKQGRELIREGARDYANQSLSHLSTLDGVSDDTNLFSAAARSSVAHALSSAKQAFLGLNRNGAVDIKPTKDGYLVSITDNAGIKSTQALTNLGQVRQLATQMYTMTGAKSAPTWMASSSLTGRMRQIAEENESKSDKTISDNNKAIQDNEDHEETRGLRVAAKKEELIADRTAAAAKTAKKINEVSTETRLAQLGQFKDNVIKIGERFRSGRGTLQDVQTLMSMRDRVKLLSPEDTYETVKRVLKNPDGTPKLDDEGKPIEYEETRNRLSDMIDDMIPSPNAYVAASDNRRAPLKLTPQQYMPVIVDGMHDFVASSDLDKKPEAAKDEALANLVRDRLKQYGVDKVYHEKFIAQSMLQYKSELAQAEQEKALKKEKQSREEAEREARRIDSLRPQGIMSAPLPTGP